MNQITLFLRTMSHSHKCNFRSRWLKTGYGACYVPAPALFADSGAGVTSEGLSAT